MPVRVAVRQYGRARGQGHSVLRPRVSVELRAGGGNAEASLTMEDTENHAGPRANVRASSPPPAVRRREALVFSSPWTSVALRALRGETLFFRAQARGPDALAENRMPLASPHTPPGSETLDLEF